MKNEKFKNQKSTAGFSLIEIIIVIGIAAILGIVTVPNYLNISKSKLLKNTVNEIVAEIESATARSRAQENENGWWVHFDNPTGENNDFYVVCEGAYTSPGSGCATEGGTQVSYTSLKAGLSFTDPSTGSSESFVFRKSTGLPTAAGSIGIANNSTTMTISIDTNGKISY